MTSLSGLRITKSVTKVSHSKRRAIRLRNEESVFGNKHRKQQQRREYHHEYPGRGSQIGNFYKGANRAVTGSRFSGWGRQR